MKTLMTYVLIHRFLFSQIVKDIYSTIEESSKQIRDEINSRFAVTSRAHQQNCIELKNAFQGIYRVILVHYDPLTPFDLRGQIFRIDDQKSFKSVKTTISDIDQLRIRVSETKNSLADRIGDVEQQLGTEIDKMKITINLLKELKQLNGEESSSFGSHLDQIDEKKARLKYLSIIFPMRKSDQVTIGNAFHFLTTPLVPYYCEITYFNRISV